MNYIYNNLENLRTTLGDVHYTDVSDAYFGTAYFAVIRCDDRCAGDWSVQKMYCGLVTKMDDAAQLRAIMNNGSKPYSLKDWLAGAAVES